MICKACGNEFQADASQPKAICPFCFTDCTDAAHLEAYNAYVARNAPRKTVVSEPPRTSRPRVSPQPPAPAVDTIRPGFDAAAARERQDGLNRLRGSRSGLADFVGSLGGKLVLFVLGAVLVLGFLPVIFQYGALKGLGKPLLAFYHRLPVFGGFYVLKAAVLKTLWFQIMSGLAAGLGIVLIRISVYSGDRR